MKFLVRCALLISAAILFSSAGYGQVLVVANPSVKADSISKSELRDVFTGATTRLKDGSKVKPVLLKQGPTHAAFVTGELSLSEVALLVGWRGLVFSGQGVMPKSFDSESAMVAFIAETPGAIGYISPSTPHGTIKILSLK